MIGFNKETLNRFEEIRDLKIQLPRDSKLQGLYRVGSDLFVGFVG